MTQAQKIDLLYRKAKGESVSMTASEKNELRKYKVTGREDDLFVTKKNIGDYVRAVDNGSHQTFLDYCNNERKADRRRKGSSESEIAWSDNTNSLAMILVGWFTWGICLYWIFKGAMSVGVAAILGAVIAFVISKFARGKAGVLVFILPIVLTVLFAR